MSGTGRLGKGLGRFEGSGSKIVSGFRYVLGNCRK